MGNNRHVFVAVALAALACVSWAQERPRPDPEPPAEPGAAITRHAGRITLQGQPLDYELFFGTLPLMEESGKPRAQVFFFAYLLPQEDRTARPITFVFNGGPGASSAYLHLGALGPRRIALPNETDVPPRRVQLLDNEQTWLPFTDLVFVDPIGTGLSRPAPGVELKAFTSVSSDVESLGAFIHLFVTRYERWLSPKFIVGESYGATRAAGLAHHLRRQWDLTLNGLVLISPALDFQTLQFEGGNDLPYVLALPSFTAAAWRHGKLPPDLQGDLPKTLTEVEAFAQQEYALALFQGDALDAGERARVADRLARYTGLPRPEIDRRDLRVSHWAFAGLLLRDERRQLGLLDARVAGVTPEPGGRYEGDPALVVTTLPLAAAMNHYLRTELRYEPRVDYVILSNTVSQSWNWSTGRGFTYVVDDLRAALSANPNLRVLLLAGMYDLATPYFSARYTLNHLALAPALRDHVRLIVYPSGHQLYTEPEVFRQFTKDAAAFIREAE